MFGVCHAVKAECASVSGRGPGLDLLPQSFKCSADGVDSGPFPGIGQEPPGLLDSFDLWETSPTVGTDPRPLPWGVLRSEDQRDSDHRTDSPVPDVC